MCKKLSKLTALLLTLAFAVGMTAPALAAPATTESHQIFKPKEGDVYYMGEKIPVEVYLTGEPNIDADWDHFFEVKSFTWLDRFDVSECTFKGTINTASQELTCKPGTHTLQAYGYYHYSDEEGTRTPTASVSFKLKALPLPAPSAKPTAKPTTKSVALTWPKVADAQKYEIWRSVKDNQHFVKYKTVTATSYTDTSVKQGVWYYYYIRSLRDKYGKTIRSIRTPVTKTALKLTAPGKPTGVKAVAGKRLVTVTWNKASLATKYQVWRSTKKASGFKKIATVSGLKYVNKGLKKGSRYYYRVKAVRVTATGTKVGAVSAPALSGKVK